MSAAVSAPGKVLFAGGFLVLDRKHTGLVFGLNARIHAQVTAWKGDPDVQLENNESSALVLVRSPQFQDANWLYQVGTRKPQDDKAVAVRQLTEIDGYTKSGNKFVEVTLAYTLTYLAHLPQDISKSIKITILADDDYYSQQHSETERVKRNGFTDFGVKLSDAHKTGLGSSAALVTSLVSSQLDFHLGSGKVRQTVIHNLAQAAHCAAQGKVGSGFDIAAAVYGSCLYKRFTPTILEHVGDATSPGFGEKLHRCVEDLDLDHKWDVEISSQAVQIPEKLLLLMCDVDCGSETPGMVRKVLQWRKDNPTEAELLWLAIQQGADDLCLQLRKTASAVGVSWTAQQELSDIIQTIRSLVREMSAKSGVPIEPDVITELLDYCTDLPGVVGGVAPGAGGYDAVALLLRNDSEVLRDLKDRLQGWRSTNEGLSAQIGRVRLLGVRQSEEGIRREDPDQYGGWI